MSSIQHYEVPSAIIGMGVGWIGKGFKKSKEDKYHDEYDE